MPNKSFSCNAIQGHNLMLLMNCMVLMQGAKWHKVEAHLKALRDLQQDQKVAGFGQQQSIRDYADIRLMMANLLAGMARMKRE